MTDQDLLEKAAKAIGLRYHAYVDHPLIGKGINLGEVNLPLWNPLDDDGDALRLAVTLRLSLHVDGNLTEAVNAKGGIATVSHLGNSLAATRRAIVCAAAELRII